MRILRHTLKIYAIKPVRVLFFSLVSACSFIPSSFPGTGINHIAYAQEANSPDNPQETNRNKLTKEQQQEIIEKNATIRKLQEGIIDHKIKILDSRKKERNLSMSGKRSGRLEIQGRFPGKNCLEHAW